MHEFTYRAFCILSGDRDSGFGEAPLRFTAIDAYARRFGIDDPDWFDCFLNKIRALDRIYLAAVADRTPKPK